ncbi:hypothetical protein [Leisingera sp. M523]|uniref:hypothetical protein n=1 Tax=Leisingera sp. M523 TaxID=2867013 RepID=UPI0021A51096|nr:hypothetical protein [Leisingera sp. M523]UWQ30253.1 hypothetical protein K3557_06870 [Leisingera sp. M523]
MRVDPHSAEWKAMRKLLERRIEEQKKRLVGLTDPIMIHRAQGRVMEANDLIEEVEPSTTQNS